MTIDGFHGIAEFDRQVSVWIQSRGSHPRLDLFFLDITDLHKQPIFIFLVILPVILYWVKKERALGFFKLLGLILTVALIDAFCGQIIKKVFARPRPFMDFVEIVKKSPASGYSFVSNHAANMAGIAMFLSVFYPRWRMLWWSLALLVGFSRIYNGVHYFSDVIAGGILGSLIAYIVSRWLQRRLGEVKK